MSGQSESIEEENLREYKEYIEEEFPNYDD
jgi:hypothetical protein